MDTNQLKKLEKAAGILMGHQKDLAVCALATLIRVALKHPHPALQHELSDNDDFSIPATSRHLNFWAGTGKRYWNATKAKLVNFDPVPSDRRYNQATLTPDGVKFMNKILKALED